MLHNRHTPQVARALACRLIHELGIHMVRFLSSSAAVALLAGVAYAADLPLPVEPIEEAVVAPDYSWTGFYVGAFGGYGWADVEVTDADGFNIGIPPVAPTTFDYDADGFYVGGLLGYNWQRNWLVLGAEAELGYLDLNESAQAPFAAVLPGESISSIETDFFGNISGRIGLAMNRILIYGKGGLAFAHVEASFVDPVVVGSQTLVAGTSEDDFIFGWTLGGGAEIGLWRNWTLRGEYMFTDLEDVTVSATASGGGTFDFEHDLENIHTVKGALSVRF
jgi:outer membrane immunogenic protein